MVKLSAIQLTSKPDVKENFTVINDLLATLDHTVEHLVVLPECCLCFGGDEQTIFELAKANQTTNRLISSLSGLAKKHQLTLVAGTIPMLSANGKKYRNTCCVFSPSGELLGDYDKIHLFDANVDDSNDDGEAHYLESSFTQAGEQVSMVDIGFAKLGLSVCYDLRFPELYRALRNLGADIITVPSAFTNVTGKAHWQALLQARAIENQCYVIAAGQQGKHENGRETWGHSMIISPWGEILSCLPEQQGVITAEYKKQEISRIRQAMPVHVHNQFNVELKN